MLYSGIQAQTIRTKRDLASELHFMLHSTEGLLATHPELKDMLVKAIDALDTWGDEEQIALNNLGTETSFAAVCERPTTATGAENVLKKSSFCAQLKAITKKIEAIYGDKDKGQSAWRKFLQPILSVLTLQNLTRVGLGVGIVGAGALAHRYLRSPPKTLQDAQAAPAAGAPYEALVENMAALMPQHDSRQHRGRGAAKKEHPWYKRNWFSKNREPKHGGGPKEEQAYEPRHARLPQQQVDYVPRLPSESHHRTSSSRMK